MRQDKTFQAIFLAYATLLLLGLCDNIRGPLYPEILKAFDVSNTVGSFFFALSSLAGFFGGLLSHKVDHRVGPLNTLRISVFVMLLTQALFSIAPNFPFLLVSSFFFGASLGVMGVAQNVLVMHALPAGPVKSRVMSGLHGTYAGASLLAPVIVNCLAYFNGPFPVWRMSFVITALIGLVILGLTFRGPELDRHVEVKEAHHAEVKETGAQIYVAVILASYVLCEILVSSRMALYMRREFDASLSESSWYTAGFFVCLLLGRVIFTIWTPALNLKKQLMISLLLSMTCLVVGIYLHPMGLALAGLCMGPFYPMMMLAAGHLFPRSASQALAWCVAMASLFVVVMHLSVGFVTDLWGLQTAFYFGPGFCALAFVMLGMYEKIFRRRQSSF